MKYYDLHISSNITEGEDDLQGIISHAKNLDLKGIGILGLEKSSIQNGVELISCALIRTSSKHELISKINSVRNKTDIIMVYGGDYDVNRAACENPMVDVLCHPEKDNMKSQESGLDYICIKEAARNKVFIEINIHELLESGWRMWRLLEKIRKNIKMCNEYGASVITNSGAVSKWGMRSGRDMAAFSNILGMPLGDALSMSSTKIEEMIKNNRKRISGNLWKGVEVSD